MLPYIFIAILGGAGTAAAAVFARSKGIAPFYGLADAEIWAAALAVSLAFVAIGSLASERRLRRRMREVTEAAARFEEAASRSLSDLSNRIDRLAESPREPVVRENAAVPAFAAASTPRPILRPVAAESRKNVFPLDAARHKHEAISADEARKALAEGRLAALYQPLIALPSRRTRILDCQPHLQVNNRDVEPDVWRGIASDANALAAADHSMLVDSVRLLRELKRADKPGRVLWRISRETLRHADRWSEIAGLLRSNQAYASYLYVETRLAELTAMTTQELDRLHELRELRCMLSLDCGHGASTVPGSLPANLFSLVRSPANSLLEPAAGGRLAVDRLRSAVPAEAEIAATGLATEEQVIALIDNDVLLAQGPLLGPAKALRRQLAGE